MGKEQEDKSLDMSIFAQVPAIDIEEDAAFMFEDEPETTETELEEPTDESKDSDIVVSDQSDEAEESISTEDDQADDSSPNLFSSLTALLVEKGLISSADSDKVQDEESFVSLFKKEIERNELNDLTENQKKYLEGLRAGIPEVEIQQNIQVTSSLESITEEMIEKDPELRQRIIYNDFINKGFSEDKAVKYMKRSIELEADVEDARDALESIKKYTADNFKKREEQIKAEQAAIEKETQDRIARIKNKIKTTNEIISGYKISDNVKESIENNMFRVVGTAPDGKEENALMRYARENKDDFELKLYYLYTITKGFQDFSVIEKTKNSKIVSDLERAVRSTTRIKDTGTPAYLQDPDSYDIEIGGHELVLD